MKVFKHRWKSPWVPTLTRPFPNGLANASSWSGTKNSLYYFAQSTNNISWVLFVCSYTTAIFSPYLSGSFIKIVRARETFYSPNQKWRNYQSVGKTFWMLSAGAFLTNLHLENSVSYRSQGIKKAISLTRQTNNFVPASCSFCTFFCCHCTLPHENA